MPPSPVRLVTWPLPYPIFSRSSTTTRSKKTRVTVHDEGNDFFGKGFVDFLSEGFNLFLRRGFSGIGDFLRLARLDIRTFSGVAWSALSQGSSSSIRL